MPFLGLTRHEVASAVLDKGLLGLVAVGFGYWLNQRMEVFRSQRATQAEFLRERTKRLDELFDLMLDVEGASTTHSLSKLLEERFGREAAREVSDEPAPGVTPEYIASTLKLSRRAARVRPWIGDALANACDEYVNLFRPIGMSKVPEGRDRGEKFAELKKRTAELQELIVAEIRRGAPAAPKRNGTP